MLPSVLYLKKLSKITSFSYSLFIMAQQVSFTVDGVEGLYCTIAGETLKQSLSVSPYQTFLSIFEIFTIGEA